MFLLRYRDPLRYAKTLDKQEYQGHDELFAIRLAKLMHRIACDDSDLIIGAPRPTRRRRQRARRNALRAADAASPSPPSDPAAPTDA